MHAGEFDLEAGFLGLGALGEDIEDDFLAVDDAEVGELFPFALLGGGEAVVDDDDVALVSAGEFDEFRGFSGAAEEFLVHLAAAVEHRLDDLDAEGFHEFREFFEQGFRFRGFAGIEVKAHQQGALDHVGLFSDFKHPGKE